MTLRSRLTSFLPARFPARTALAIAAAGSIAAWPLLGAAPIAADVGTIEPSVAAPGVGAPVLRGAALGDVRPPQRADGNERNPADSRSAGVQWLKQHQNADGGWGAGGHGSRAAQAPSDVATTALAVLALFRDDPSGARHRESIERGVDYVLEVVEASPADGPRLQVPQGTQPQYKLGTYVDTHFASLLLGEITGRIAAPLEERLTIAYDKVLSKVVAAQQGDGSFDRDGWAPVLSSSVAAQSLYRAIANGKDLPSEVMAKADAYQNGLVDAEAGSFDASRGAGVPLYAAASGLRGNAQAEKRPGGAAPAARRAKEASIDAVRGDAERLIRGFGSVGGEEMLSYMMISDTLAEESGEDFDVWQQRIGRHLSGSQNADGSWSGHHCITSTPFVTAAAVMTLGAAPAPAADGGAAAGRPLARQ